MTTKKKILLAEDDADDRDIFNFFLKDRSDITILDCVENGLQILEFLDAATDMNALPDLILLDHNMPKMTGRKTLETLKSDLKFSAIPVFIYSTYADKPFIDKCLQSGAAMVCEKPATKQDYYLMMDVFLRCIQA